MLLFICEEVIAVEKISAIVPPVNDTPYKRIWAIGDVHGNFTRLMSLWQKLNVMDDSLAIFLGDYIDRGAEVAEVLKWILSQSTQENFIFLRGNHEQMMLDVSHGRLDKLTWLFNGGQSTLRGLSELKAVDENFIDKILNFAESLPLYHTMTVGGRQYIFVHAGIDSRLPLAEQKPQFLLWAREEFFNTYDGEAVVISGHSPLQAFPKFGVADNPRPIKLPDKNVVLIDTGSFIRGGKISALDILSGEYWQSDSD